MSENGNAKNEDLKIAFAGVIATIAKNSPKESPTALIGAGIISGILLHAADGPQMERVIEATFDESQLAGSRISARQIITLFRTLEDLHNQGLAGDDAGVAARRKLLGQD